MAGPARVFISYSSADSDIVNRLKQGLADAGVPVWLDHEQLTPGTAELAGRRAPGASPRRQW